MACAAAGAKVWLATACCSRRAPTLMVRRRAVSTAATSSSGRNSNVRRPPARKQRPHLRNDALVVGRAPVRQIYGDRHRTSEGKNRGARTSTVPNNEARPTHTDILEQPLQPTIRAGPRLAAIVLRLRLNKVVSQSRERPSETWGRYGQRHQQPVFVPGGVPQVVATPR